MSTKNINLRKIATAISREEGISKDAAAKFVIKETEKFVKRMNEISGSKKVVINIPTTFYEKILESRINRVNENISDYITDLIVLDLGKD